MVASQLSGPSGHQWLMDRMLKDLRVASPQLPGQACDAQSPHRAEAAEYNTLGDWSTQVRGEERGEADAVKAGDRTRAGRDLFVAHPCIRGCPRVS